MRMIRANRFARIALRQPVPLRPQSITPKGVHTDLVTARECKHWFCSTLVISSSLQFATSRTRTRPFAQYLYLGALPFQPAPKYHTKGCSHSTADSPGARTLVFAAFEPFHSCEFRASIARTPFCAILWRSPTIENR